MKKRKLKFGSRQGASRAPITLAPTTWDMGADGKANRHGLEQEDAVEVDPETGKKSNPNGVVRMRRVDMIEVWHRKRVISTDGYNAAEKLRDAFERTQCAPGWPEAERVDSSPKPDHAVTIQITRLSRYHAIARCVHPDDRDILSACVLSGATPAALRRYKGRAYQAGLEHLRDALDRLASALAKK